MLVAGEDDVEVAFLVVPPVDQVKEQQGILFVELAVAHLINNQAGWTHQAVDNGCFLASPSGGSKFVPQLRHLNEIGFNSSLTALVAECLGQMGLAGSGRVNECQVPVGVDGRQEPGSVFSLAAS